MHYPVDPLDDGHRTISPLRPTRIASQMHSTSNDSSVSRQKAADFFFENRSIGRPDVFRIDSTISID